MQTTQRYDEPDVIERLVAEPFRVQFVQAVKLILRRLRENGVQHDEAFRTIIRFQNSLSLRFPASEIEAIAMIERSQSEYAGASADPGDEGKVPRRVVLTPTFIGLLGVHGTLPLHHSERFAALQPRESDASARSFIDVFSNRMVALYFDAWGKYRVEHQLDTIGRDTLLPMLKALGGTPLAHDTSWEHETAGASDPSDHVAGYYAGLLRARPVSASAVSRILTEYFGVPIAIEEFAGCWDAIPADKRTTLGGAAARLGYGFSLGVRTWRNDLRVRLRIGPLDQQALEDFLPKASAARALEKMLSAMAIPCMQYEARLMLSRPCVRTMTLKTSGNAAGQKLGWNTFITTQAAAVASPEVRYRLQPTT
jgi:type VI secretion system protein ImpH